MSLHSKWEHLLTIPTGDWTMSLTESGGGGAQTITLTAANTYYWSSAGNDTVDLAARLKALLDAASVAAGNSNTYTVTIAAGELGTGKLTIAVSAGTFTLTSINDDAQALMGFTAELTPTAASFTSDKQVESLWLPDTTVETPQGLASSGKVVSTSLVTVSEDGTVSNVHGSKHVRNEYVYAFVPVAKAIQASESVTNTSFESWWLHGIRGQEPWAKAGQQVRYYKDADADGTSLTFNAIPQQSPQSERTQADYDGFWTIRLDVIEN